MIKEAIGIGATIDDARKMAIESLHAPIEADVKVEIVEMPKKKLLGLFGGSDAKVKAFYDDGVEEKPAVKEKSAAPKAEKKPAAEAPKKVEKKLQPKKENKEVKEQPKAAAEPEIDLSAIEAKKTDATAYLESIIRGMGFADAEVVARETENDIYFEITCSDDYGNIIGRRGETLDALQYLTRLFVNRSENSNKRVALNVGDYRKHREEALRSLAKRQAARVAKYGRSSALEPMNPYERRIIHTAIQEIDGVTSHSVGEGDRRRVVITPADGERKGGYSRERRGDRRERRAPYVPQTSAEPREQKVDAAASSRYGKIEPRKPAAVEAEAPAEE